MTKGRFLEEHKNLKRSTINCKSRPEDKTNEERCYMDVDNKRMLNLNFADEWIRPSDIQIMVGRLERV